MKSPDPWRRRCPRGHSNVQRRLDDDQHGRSPESPFYCDTCKDAGLDPHHDHVVDAKTGREITA